MSRKTRKLIWSAPLIAVVAVIGALALFMTLQPNVAAAQSLQTPGQVQDFTAEATGPDTIKLTWNAPTEGGRQTGYRVDVSDDGLTWELLSESVPGQDDEYEHDSLMARETKYYRIFAHNQGGGQIGPVAMSSPAYIATLASTVPDSPTDLTVVQGSTPQTMLTLTWTPPETPDGTAIHQYKVAFAQNPDNLSQSQSRTLTVSEVPTSDADMVYCGSDGTDDCEYTFRGLLEHETWHFQVYAVNEDASGEVGNSNPSDSESLATADGSIPAHPTAVWAAVNKSSPGVWLYWTPPANPAGAPVTDYLVQGRPITSNSTEVTVDNDPTDTVWGDKPGNVVVFHNRTTADLLLTSSELRAAAHTAWQADDQNDSDGTTADVNDGDLDALGNDDDAYFSNLEWEFRVLALNSVWKREVQNEPVNYAATLEDPTIDTSRQTDQPAFPDPPPEAGVTVNINRSDTLRVSLNELNEAATDVTPPGVGDIAPNRVDLQNRISRVKADKDDDTNGGRTKIDIEWPRTYSHTQFYEDENDNGVYNTGDTPEVFLQTDGTYNVEADGTGRAVDASDVVTQYHYATMYRVQWSTNPDASDWNLLDADANTTGHQDFLADVANVNHQGAECDDGTCSVSHSGLTAGKKYTYRVFAMNAVSAEGATTNEANTVFSWWQVGSATTSQAEVPGRPLGLIANQSISNGHTEIDLVWNPPTSDHDGGGDGDGYGVIIEYDIEKSDDGGNSWSSLAMVTPAKACKAGGTTGATHKLKENGSVTVCEYTHEELAPGQTVRYRVLTVNVGPRERMSDWSDTTTQTTEQSTKPDKPEGLVAEAAGRSMINLMWNIQSRTPPAAPILAYIIEYMMGTEWVQVARISDADSADNQNDVVRTIHTDTGLDAETERTYRVRAQNEPALGTMDVSEESEHAEATTDAAMAPGAPMASALATSDTEITVTWTAPADGGSDITGWIVEKAYGGSFLDVERTNDDAFTDAQTWWDGLDCSAMVMAVMDSGTADMDNPYCKMYADLAMAEEDEVERVFGARYDVIDDAAKTDATYSDLTPETAYMYRVAAVNTVGLGAWSNEATATTLAVDTTLGDASGLTATVDDSDPGAITVELSWTAGANANIHWVAGARKNNDGTYDVSTGNLYWSRADMNGSHSVDTTGLNSGTYSFTVIAGQLADDDTENWDSAWVMPFAEVELP